MADQSATFPVAVDVVNAKLNNYPTAQFLQEGAALATGGEFNDQQRRLTVTEFTHSRERF
jgi:hypothetical protein